MNQPVDGLEVYARGVRREEHQLSSPRLISNSS